METLSLVLHKALGILIAMAVLRASSSEKVTSVRDNENNPYHHIVNLDGEPGRYVLEWTVDWNRRRVTFQVTVKTRGFIILGLSRRGELAGADLVIGGVDSRTGVAYLEDMHGSSEVPSRIQLDRSQDYELISARENRTHTRLRFPRKFDTCDDEDKDYRINDDTVTILWGYGENDFNDYGDAHRYVHGNYKTYLLDPDWTPRVLQEAKRTGKQLTERELGDLEIWTVTRNQRVPARETTYWCSIHKGPVLQRKHHLVGFDFRWENTLQYNHTHHLLLYRCTPPSGVDQNEFFGPFVQNNTGEMCFMMGRGESQQGSLPTAYCDEVMFAYAIGARQFFLPEEAGIPFGDSPDEYYLLQVHYDNPEELSNIEYEVHIDMYYTPSLRPQDAGIMTIGHQIPGSPSILIPPNSLDHNIYGHCGGSCTSRMLPPEGVKILGVQQHTHYSGVRHRFQHFRGNKELPWIFNDDNYENHFQPTRMTRNEVRVLPGDQLTTTCAYDISWANGSTVVGGLSTRQEMCLVYIWYANKVDYRQCRSEIADVGYFTQKHLGVANWTWSEPDLEYVASDGSNRDGLTVSQVSNLQNWSTRRKQDLIQDQILLGHQSYCASSSSVRMGGNAVTQAPIVRYPLGVRDYVPVIHKRHCQKGRPLKR